MIWTQGYGDIGMGTRDMRTWTWRDGDTGIWGNRHRDMGKGGDGKVVTWAQGYGDTEMQRHDGIGMEA